MVVGFRRLPLFAEAISSWITPTISTTTWTQEARPSITSSIAEEHHLRRTRHLHRTRTPTATSAVHMRNTWMFQRSFSPEKPWYRNVLSHCRRCAFCNKECGESQKDLHHHALENGYFNGVCCRLKLMEHEEICYENWNNDAEKKITSKSSKGINWSAVPLPCYKQSCEG